MEKRLLLAFLLSFSVLFIWTGLFPKPKIEQTKPSIKSEVIGNKDVMENYAPLISGSKPQTINKVEVKVSPESEKTTLENSKIFLEFTNVGGTLESATVKEFNVAQPVKNILTVKGLENVSFDLKHRGEGEIIYVYETEDILITKSYFVPEDEYIVNARVDFEAKDKMSNLGKMSIGALTVDMSNLENGGKGIFSKGTSSRDRMLYEYALAFEGNVKRKRNAAKFAAKEAKSGSESLAWVGFRDRYYATIVKLLDGQSGYSIDVPNDKMIDINFGTESLAIKPYEKKQFEGVIYVGPQETSVMKKYGMGFERIVSYDIGGFFDIFALGLGDPSAKVMLALLKLLQKVLHSWGACIIIIAVLVCGVTYPLMQKSMSSMKRMQKLQPEMEALKQKYKNNPQKMQQETMALYKQHKVNPFGGCLPMFLQMPVIFGVIQLMWRYVGFKGKSFLWIKDLSEPDRLFIMPISVPILGNEINILPILVFFLSMLQQKFSSKNMVSTDPNVVMQQKMMKYMFPAMIILFFYKFPSSMGLYFTVFYSFNVFTQWKMSKEK